MGWMIEKASVFTVPTCADVMGGLEELPHTEVAPSRGGGGGNSRLT